MIGVHPPPLSILFYISKEMIFLLSYSFPTARKSVIVTSAGEPRA